MKLATMADLDRRDLIKMRDFVLQDDVALSKWTIVVDHIVTLASDARKIKAKLQKQDHAEAVLRTLQIWHGAGKELQFFLAVLESLELNLLVEKFRSFAKRTEKLHQHQQQAEKPVAHVAQVISFCSGRQPEFILDHNLLESVFAPAADKEVKLIVICGSARQGRSFLLNLILRGLRSVELGRNDFLGWDDTTPDVLSGFAWGPCEERKTIGVWITKNPIMIRSATNGTEVALYLMDTQGVLDEFSSASQTKFILQLCLHVSSTLIFSTTHELHEHTLLTLGRTITSMKSSRPCEHLYIVVRDWSQPELYPSNETGGQKYKTKRLQVQDHHSDASRTARNSLQSKMSNIDCYLLPIPGPNARKLGYGGNVAGLNAKFKMGLELLVRNIINQDKLLAETVSKVTGSDLISLFKTYVSSSSGFETHVYQPPETPNSVMSNDDQLQDPLMELADEYKTQLSAAIKTAPNQFLDSTLFELTHDKLRTTACETYANRKFKASFATLQTYQKLLEKRLDAYHTELKELNDERREKCLGDWNQALEKATKAYREEVQNLLRKSKPVTFVKETMMKERIAKEMREYFDSLVEQGMEEVYTTYSNNLVERFSKIFQEEKTALNQRIAEERQEQLDACRTAALDQFVMSLCNWKTEHGFLSKEKLQEGLLLAEEEAHAILKAWTFHKQDESATAQLFMDLNTKLKQLTKVEMTELKAKIEHRQRHIEILTKSHRNAMLEEIQNLQVPTPEAVIALHEAIFEKIVLQVDVEDKTGLKNDLHHVLAENPLKEYQGAGAIRLQQLKRHADHLVKAVISEYIRTLEEAKLLICNSSHVFEKHTQILDMVLQTFSADIGVQDATFLQPYVDQIKMKVQEHYEKHVGYLGRNTMTTTTPSKDIAVGFCLGNKFSSVAAYLVTPLGNVEVIPTELGGFTVPSYVAMTKDGKPVVGEPAKRLAYTRPADTIYDLNRVIGRDFHDPVLQSDMKLWPFVVAKDAGSEKAVIISHGIPQRPERILANLITYLKNLAEEHLECPNIKRAVITVPSYFHTDQRQAIIDAASFAGLPLVQLINEPTAAVVAHNFYRYSNCPADGKMVLVCSLVEDSFDVTIFEWKNSNFVITSANRDTSLGVKDFDQAMVEFCIEKFKVATGVDINLKKTTAAKSDEMAAGVNLVRLRYKCDEKGKELLVAAHTTVELDGVFGFDLNVKVSRADFEEMNRDKFDRMIKIVQYTLKNTALSPDQLDDIVLVGIGTRIPKIQQLISNVFGGRKLNREINQNLIVARGAAILAAKLNGEAAQKAMDMGNGFN